MQTHIKYSPRTDVDWEEIKKGSLKYCAANYGVDSHLTEADVVEELRPLWNTLKSVDFDINQFFSRKLYLDIPDEGLNEYIIIVCLLAVQPMSDLVVDWLNGYLDFDFINPNIAAGAEWKPADEMEILEYLWYCQKDEDIWWMMGQGIGIIKDLYDWYMGDITSPDWFVRPPCCFIKDEKKEKIIPVLPIVITLISGIGFTNC